MYASSTSPLRQYFTLPWLSSFVHLRDHLVFLEDIETAVGQVGLEEPWTGDTQIVSNASIFLSVCYVSWRRSQSDKVLSLKDTSRRAWFANDHGPGFPDDSGGEDVADAGCGEDVFDELVGAIDSVGGSYCGPRT